MIIQETDIVFAKDGDWPSVSVVIPLYNYDRYITEALDCVAGQTLNQVGLVVIDDCSKDTSLQVVESWMCSNADRFSSAMLTTNQTNAGLAITRNTGASLTTSPFLFYLDADNQIYPRCLASLYEALATSSAAFAYSMLEVFDGESGLMGTEVFDRNRLKHGNYIDAMALVRRDSLLDQDGYNNIEHGWEDYDLWLRFCEDGEFGLHVPEILGRYRVHQQSMIRTVTSVEENYRELRNNMVERHPWIEI